MKRPIATIVLEANVVKIRWGGKRNVKMLAEETYHTRSPDSKSPACSTTPASLRTYTEEDAGHTGSGCKLQSHTSNYHMAQIFSSILSSIYSLTHRRNSLKREAVTSPQIFCGQQLMSSARLMITSAVRWHTGAATLEQLYSTGTMVSLSQRYMQQASLEAFHTSPCARGMPELSVQAVRHKAQVFGSLHDL